MCFISNFFFVTWGFRILSIIEENVVTNSINSSSKFETKTNLDKDGDTKTTVVLDHDELQDVQFQPINTTTSVRNITVNEDIPSFREWTKKQLEEAEKQPGKKLCYIVT